MGEGKEIDGLFLSCSLALPLSRFLALSNSLARALTLVCSQSLAHEPSRTLKLILQHPNSNPAHTHSHSTSIAYLNTTV